MKLQQYATMRGYQDAYQLNHRIPEADKLKRLQFDTSPDLFELVEEICSKLECTKREFLEMAVLEGIEHAHKFFDEALYEAADPDILGQVSSPVEG